MCSVDKMIALLVKLLHVGDSAETAAQVAQQTADTEEQRRSMGQLGQCLGAIKSLLRQAVAQCKNAAELASVIRAPTVRAAWAELQLDKAEVHAQRAAAFGNGPGNGSGSGAGERAAANYTLLQAVQSARRKTVARWRKASGKPSVRSQQRAKVRLAKQRGKAQRPASAAAHATDGYQSSSSG